MLTTLRKNVKWGVSWGLGAAIVLTLLAAPFSFFRWLSVSAVAAPGSLSFLRIVAMYLFSAIMGGTLLGLLKPLLSWWIGRRIVGVVVGIPLAFGIRLMVHGPDGWSQEEVENWLITGVIWGLIMSFGPETWSRDAKRNLRALRRKGEIPDLRSRRREGIVPDQQS